MKRLKRLIIKIIARFLSAVLPKKVMRNKSFFHLWESKGYHITPVHFYENIPDTRTFKPDLFDKESNMAGIEINETAQIKLLEGFCSRYKSEYSEFSYTKINDNSDFYFGNGSYETIDAEILYCMVRNNKPKHIIEIGSGFSTLLTAKAIKKNKIEDSNYNCEFTCIEPYPKKWLKNIPEVTKIIQAFVESQPLELFKTLNDDDILFIDSSHTVKVNNDVCYEYLDILPNLNKGVIIHIHDILLPKYYCQYWFDMKVFWNEQYLLQSFLAFNTSFKILWAGNFMHLKHPKELGESIPSYLWFKENKDKRKQLQGHKSFWIKKTN